MWAKKKYFLSYVFDSMPYNTKHYFAEIETCPRIDNIKHAKKTG